MDQYQSRTAAELLKEYAELLDFGEDVSNSSGRVDMQFNNSRKVSIHTDIIARALVESINVRVEQIVRLLKELGVTVS